MGENKVLNKCCSPDFDPKKILSFGEDMGENKVLNKCCPPDFDPKKILSFGEPKNQPKKIRLMLPMSIWCNTCDNHMSGGTRFNCRVEEVAGEMYLGIQIRRFYIKCTECLAEVTLKAHLKNSDYIVESGATCFYNGHQEEEEEEEEEEENAI